MRTRALGWPARRSAGLTAAGVAIGVAVAVLQGPPAQAAPDPVQQAPQEERVVTGKDAAAVSPALADPAAEAAKVRRPEPRWPAAAAADVALPATGAAPAGDGLPVTLARGGADAPTRARVELMGRDATAAAGVDGLLLRVRRTDGAADAGPARIAVDYSAVRDAFGADWASRLRLVRLPECTLDPAERAKAGADCRPEYVVAANDLRAGTLSATVALPPANTTGAVSTGSGLLAVTAGSSGPAGSYAATGLSPSATWQAGNSSGDFSWSYPLRVPPALGGPVPSLDLAYSAQSVDGRTAASNNQPSWAGEGFEFWPGGYVERRYRGCADDQAGGNNATKTGDQCWVTDNATLSLNGRTTELVRDDATGAFRPRADDGSRVERMTGAANGDNNGEHWRVTTPNGTQYWFGRNRLPGWSDGKAETRSAWTVPVFGNQAGEPCHATTFAASSCTQAWRWNLDHVVDPHGNTMSFWYTPQTNRYARNLASGDAVSYVRDGSLDRIDYGTNVRSGAESVFGTSAPFRVTFTGADRCLSGCTAHTAAAWPDVPWDQQCTAAPCSQYSPTFWSTRRLASVTTQVRDGTGYRDVESWSFTHSFPDPGDGTRAGLWLASIAHTGRAVAGAPVTVPDVAFAGVQKANRVDGNDHSPAMNWWRIADIRTESGGRISVKYTDPECVAGSRMPAAAHINTMRCYPVRWTPDLLTAPVTDWFHKYVVTDVVETDTVGGGGTSTPRVLTHYDYGGTPAWHWTDDELTPEKDRTWSGWRGYERVTTVLGDADTTRTASETRFYRGMNGDKLPTGTRTATVTDSLGGTRADDDWLAGSVREQRVLAGPGGAEVSGTLNEPWASAPTATRVAGGVTVRARLTGTAETRTRAVLDGGRGTRTQVTSTTFDDRGQALTVEDGGDAAVAGDEQCSRTTYARNTSGWLISYPSRVESFAVSCAAAANTAALTEDDVVGDARTSYDGQAWGAAPTKGDVTRVEQLSGWSPARYVTVARTQYDAHGRATGTWDALDRHTGTAYAPAADGPLTRVTTTNAAGHVAVEDRDPAYGDPLLTVDPNGRRAERTYDGLGRLTAVWGPDRPRSATPSASYAYLMRNDKPTAVTSSVLDATGGYTTSIALFDGLLRERQTQREAEGGTAGRIVAETLYDSAGRVARVREDYLTTGDPGTDLFVPGGGDATIPRQTVRAYDGAGRPTAAAFVSLGVERWRSTTSYGGDRSDVVPPEGGTVTSTVVDVRGREVERRLYHGRTPGGAFDRIRYTIDRKGRQTKVEDPAGNVWEYRYDLRGRQVRVADPDKGVVTSAFDDAGQAVSTSDARGVTLVTGYDALGRQTDLREGAATGPKRAEWVYDTVAKGVLYSSTRFEGGDAYRTTVDAVDAAYRPTSSSVTVPASLGALAGTYTTTATYRPDGSPATTRLPAAGGLPAETLTTGYDGDGNAATLTTSAAAGSYVSGTSYTALGELGVTSRRTVDGRIVQVGQYYEEDTRRLNRTWITGETAPATISDVRYRRDAAGQLVQLSDVPQGRPADVQCFRNDYRQRLVAAWTPGDGDCAADPALARLGGPAPYWRSWAYDVAGNRTARVDRSAAGTSTTTYGLPPAGGPRPHAVGTATTADAAGTRTVRFGYDDAGNTVSRPAPGGGEQVLTWDPEGHLATGTDHGVTTRFGYDADGDRLLRKDGTGTTLYLPGQELRLTAATGAVTAVRLYSHGDDVVAQRTPAGLTWLVADWQGTQQIAVDPVSQAVTRRRQTPDGTSRGPAVTWPNEHGYVGGDVDPGGTVHLGAREYDPEVGRFLSVDPVFSATNPDQMNAYGYADGNPASASDPDGLCAGRDYGDLCPGQSLESQWTAGPIPQGYQSPWNNKGDDKAPAAGGGPAKTKPKCGTFDVKCKAKKAWTATTNFVEEHKATIAGIAAGVATGLVCGAAIGWTGGGAVVCGALAGAVGSLVHDMVEGGHGWKEMAGNAVVGAAFGAVAGGLLGNAGALAGAARSAVGRAAPAIRGAGQAVGHAFGTGAVAAGRAVATAGRAVGRASATAARWVGGKAARGYREVYWMAGTNFYNKMAGSVGGAWGKAAGTMVPSIGPQGGKLIGQAIGRYAVPGYDAVRRFVLTHVLPPRLPPP